MQLSNNFETFTNDLQVLCKLFFEHFKHLESVKFSNKRFSSFILQILIYLIYAKLTYLF